MTHRFRHTPIQRTLIAGGLFLSFVAFGSSAGAQTPPGGDAQQPVAQQPVSQQPVSQPPAAQPPGTQPPAAQPPVAEQQLQPPLTMPALPDAGSYLTPKPGRIQRTISWATAKVDTPGQKHEGFYPQFGSMIAGAGLSIGPGFKHGVFGDAAVIDVSAAMSWRRYRAIDAQFAWPKLMHDRLAIGAQARYQDFTKINYFGIGNDSAEADRTDYRLKSIDALGFVTARANNWLSITGRAGELRKLDIEPGTSPLYPTIGERFDDATAPGLAQQPNYLHADVAVDADTRDVPGYPKQGGRYRLSMAAYHDQTFGRYSFRRVEADAAQYVPLGRSVVALRGRMDLSQDGGQDIPFYLLPALGGSSTLRGYADYRFRDRDLLMVNAEYRLPIVRMADFAVFYDAGTVAAQARSLTKGVHKDYGVGVRLHSATHSLVRLDVARGTEGTRINLTVSAPLGFSKGSVAPYVP